MNDRNVAEVPAGTTIRGQYISLRYNQSASYTPRRSPLLHQTSSKLTGPLPVILANNIDLHAGRIEVTVPTVFSAGYYSLLRTSIYTCLG